MLLFPVRRVHGFCYMWTLAYLDLCKRNEKSLKYRPDANLCSHLGLDGKTQMRDMPCQKNLWWTFEPSHIAFGFGDLNELDLRRILSYVRHPNHEAPIVFLGWHENHGSRNQWTVYPIVRVDRDGITYPAREAQREVMKVVR